MLTAKEADIQGTTATATQGPRVPPQQCWSFTTSNSKASFKLCKKKGIKKSFLQERLGWEVTSVMPQGQEEPAHFIGK